MVLNSQGVIFHFGAVVHKGAGREQVYQMLKPRLSSYAVELFNLPLVHKKRSRLNAR
jgi:hypothetical protein